MTVKNTEFNQEKTASHPSLSLFCNSPVSNITHLEIHGGCSGVYTATLIEMDFRVSV
jgi:hypothetical protein